MKTRVNVLPRQPHEDHGAHRTSERFHLVVEVCAGGGTGAGQTFVAVVEAGGIVSMGATLLRDRQEGHVKTGNRNETRRLNRHIQPLWLETR